MNTVEEAREICEVFLTRPFSGAERHARRLAMVDAYELDGEPPPIPASELWIELTPGERPARLPRRGPGDGASPHN